MSAVKDGLQLYGDKVHSRSSINLMWMLKNSEDLDSFNSRSFLKISSIETLDFYTFYTTISHEKLKPSLNDIIHNTVYFENYTTRYYLIVLDHALTYVVKLDINDKKWYTTISMWEFIINKIFV